MNDAVPIALEGGTDRILGLRAQPAPRVAALGRLGRQDLALALLEFLADRHLGRVPRAGHSRLHVGLLYFPSFASSPVSTRSRKLVPDCSRPTPSASATVWPKSAK